MEIKESGAERGRPEGHEDGACFANLVAGSQIPRLALVVGKEPGHLSPGCLLATRRGQTQS